MTGWQPVDPDNNYGVVIYNYNENTEYRLKLNVGDAVHIEEEDGDWYFGYSYNNRHVKGIFPKNYVHIKYSVNKEPPIVREITTVLREWGAHWKNLYITHNKNFEIIKNRMYDLVNLRSKIISGTLPVDELKSVTKQSTAEIDIGNKILGLDLVVRDKNGNLINPQETSTIQLYYYHKNATERMSQGVNKVELKENQAKTAIQQYSNIFIVTVKNFTCKMSEDAELLMTLYDGKEYRAITENYVVKWSKDGLMSDLDQMYNLRVMFTDLGKKDLEREKIYLVCYVVRIGAMMDVKETDHRRSSISIVNKRSTVDGMRRPFGVAAMEVTSFMNGKRESDLEQEFSVPFVNCEKDNLEQTLKKIINKDYTKSENKNQALFVSLKLLHGDVKQVREENPHLILGNISIARKMGFPEVILPGDVRNDLYLTLICGEFAKGNKTSDKNVEVVVKVCNEKGEAIPGVTSLGGGTRPLNEYRSVVYYHEDKPQWFETFKIAIPIEEFKTSHIKFTFKHRSSNEAKDKSEKPFAMSYVPLMQKNGTTLKDAKHNLIVYKIDYRKFDENSLDYIQLPPFVTDVKDNQKPQANGLIINTKDSFTIATNICSTKLTQNVDLLGLLNWASHKETIKASLQALMKVDGEEVVKFLQDILDALFNIIMDNPESDVYDMLVFECLLFIVGLVSNDWKYQHFEPVLDLYIEESFSATLAYKKLISVLNTIINSSMYTIADAKDHLVFKTMKSLQYIMRFVSKSRILYMALYPDDQVDNFESSLQELLNSICRLMSEESDSLLREQGACLKYLPSTIPDIVNVFDHLKFSRILCNLLQNIATGRLTKQKMMTVNEIVHSKLFLYPECREIMLPVFTKKIKLLFETCEEGLAVSRQDGRRQNRSVAKVARVLGATQHCLNQHRGYSEEVELCIKILSDILELLFRKNVGSTVKDITEIMYTVLRTIIQSHINMDRESPYTGNLVAIMIDIFRQMTDYHYQLYIKHFPTRSDVLDFLMEILLVFKELVSGSIFPSDWCDMIMLQNQIILDALRFFSHTIRDCFFEKFESQAWSNFFHCAIAFMTQPALQLENFTHNKRTRIISRYKDMRRETGFEIRSMWFNLGQYKVQFVPSLVGSVLEMTLIPEPELRKATIPIFFDMMQCEFYSSKIEFESYGDTKLHSAHIKANFNDFENEMIAKLDILVEGGRGDEQYKCLFHDIMVDLCSQHTTMREEGVKFVNMVTRLMERLLEYRSVINDDENKESRMSCTVNLLDFYSEINRKEMYIRYVNKLCDLHLECDNFTEAAYTLELHSNLLKWSDEPLPPLLKSSRQLDSQTHRQLKESLYYNIINHCNKGRMWELALEKCQELAEQYEKETYDYEQLSELHKMMASFYEDIMKKIRPDPEYFRVGYYGNGFPQFLRNKVFIYRGKEYERLADFNSRILNEFPKAELLNKLVPPGEDLTESDKQYLQINKVDPIMDDNNKRFSGKPVAEQILNYYKANHINKFTYSRPFTRRDPDTESDNEFASLWLERTILVTTYPLPGILRWFPVKATNTFEISPLRNAIETMEKTNKSLKNSILLYKTDKSVNINPLSLLLTGILDAKVMGGIRNYEEAFFESDYESHHPEDVVLIRKLKDLIADQIPLLDLCVQIHKERIPMSLGPLQKQLEDCFSKMQESVIEKYGKRTCNIKLEHHPVTIRRQFHTNSGDSMKHSDTTSLVIDNNLMVEEARIRISSITKSQVTAFKHLTSTFNFTSAAFPTGESSKSHQYSSGGNSKSLLSPSKSLTNNSTMTYKKTQKTPKEKRRSSKCDSITTNNFTQTTQWYTTPGDNETIISLPTANGKQVVELRQELRAKRPLRSEVEKEKRLSRSSAGGGCQFTQRPNSLTVGAPNSSGNSSSRDSFGTTDSSVSEEDAIPPPLPLKLREVDYCNSLLMENTSFLYSNRHRPNSLRIQSVGSTADSPIDGGESLTPPTPPPKPPKIKNQDVMDSM